MTIQDDSVAQGAGRNIWPNVVTPFVTCDAVHRLTLLAGSPAINTGAGCQATDQRAYVRDTLCDIGAFEYGAASTLVSTTITYSYDRLYRLTAAIYSDGRYFHYSYDPDGNILTETKCLTAGGCPSPLTFTYVYDIANRVQSVNGLPYTWDNNGNLLSDGANTYTYNAADRLTAVSGSGVTSSFTYNGLGDRVSQITELQEIMTS